MMAERVLYMISILYIMSIFYVYLFRFMKVMTVIMLSQCVIFA